jgi:cysteinyl-tRNA synthetase
LWNPVVQLRLHNTLTRRKEVFEPADPLNVRVYVCGPTVYQRIHVGNARPLIVFDVLFRLLRHLYGEKHVTYVRNITDIEDKIIAQAAANGESIQDLTSRTTRQFHEDVAALGCLPPTHEPRATEHVPGMIAIIEALIAKGHAYAEQDHVLFNVPSMPTYGRLSGRDRADQIAGARVEVAPYKRDPADFVLWKPSEPDQPGWDSPWGRGRPGWHIECSAMSEALLGPLPFDIHGGGLDLIFPHHENEIAQSCCAREVDRMARFWLHNGFVDMRGEKMAKSVGNVVRVNEALATAPGEALRFWMLGTHYRQPIDYSDELLGEAKRTLDRFYGALARVPPSGASGPDAKLVEALADDLNTPKALAVFNELLKDLNSTRDREAAACVHASGAIMGLLDADPIHWLHKGATQFIETPLIRAPARFAASEVDSSASEERIEKMIAERHEARRARNFARADAIRAELAAQGIALEDGPHGTSWRRV